MLTRPHCQQCAMMKRILGDRVEYADAIDLALIEQMYVWEGEG